MHRSLRVCAALLLLSACDSPPASLDVGMDVGSDAPPPDAGAADTSALTDTAQDAWLGCTRAGSGFPRALGLPMPEPDGVFDPDVARDPDTGRLWMAYSAVDGAPGTGRVSTHLAYSEDDGSTWCYQGPVNVADLVRAEDLPVGVSATGGHWANETSAIVHDPDAPPSTRWRLLWHRYLHVNEPAGPEARLFQYGWIAQRTAATPAELLTAPDQKLFSAGAYYFDPSVSGYNDAQPGGLPITRLDALPGLEGCVVATEPAVLSHGGVLYAALYCARTATDAEVALLRLDTSLDTWTYLGALVDNTDAASIDPSYLGFNAADLVAYEGGVRLLLTPTSNDRYRGCLAFEADLATATLTDTGGDGPDVTFSLPLGNTLVAPFGGACTFLEGSALGLIYGEIRTMGPAFTVTASGTTGL